jgi:hypothetical protein
MLSSIGRDSRIIQAHMCPREQRLKVRYSQLVDFSYFTPELRDMFLRWLLCDPITEPKPLEDGSEPSASEVGDTAPQLTASEATSSLPSAGFEENLANGFARLSTRSTIMVA